jgi:hypothetical protein
MIATRPPSGTTPALAAFLNEKKEGAFPGFVRPAAGKGVAIVAQRMFRPPTPANVDRANRRGRIRDQSGQRRAAFDAAARPPVNGRDAAVAVTPASPGASRQC